MLVEVCPTRSEVPEMIARARTGRPWIASAALAGALVCPAALSSQNPEPIEPLVIRVSDAWTTPGGQAAIVLRTYASRPVRRGKIVVRRGAGLVAGVSAPIDSWDSAVLFNAAGESMPVDLVPTQDGLGIELDFLDNLSFEFNRADGVVAVLYATVSPGAVPGDYPLLGDDAASELRDPEDDSVLLQLRPGELRIRSAAAPVELGSGDVEVHPGSGAEIEIGTGERFAIGSGTLVLTYDPAVLLPGSAPTVTTDVRHGLADLTIDTTTPGTIEIQIDSPDGSFNAEVPGDLLVVHLPTNPGVPLGTDSPLVFAAGSELFDPSQAPIDVFFEGGQIQFRSDPGVFSDNFGIGDFGWWQLHP
jgi:hypothetical protein